MSIVYQGHRDRIYNRKIIKKKSNNNGYHKMYV